MTDNTGEKIAAPQKSFMTVGPTLHYSHSNVRRCWLLAMGVYLLASLFWTKITGTSALPGLANALARDSWCLGEIILAPISIYEYPWQIFVLGLVMGILAAGPVVVSQLLSFRYSLLMIVSVVVFAKLPLFGLSLVVSCIAVACRPLRFRSRFIAIILCMSPQMLYWGIYGSVAAADPIKFGFSYAPWICSWFTGVAIAGIVIGIGHYTRYKPGLVWAVTLVVLGIAFALFEGKISSSELDYQLYVAGNNPETASEFHDRDMSEIITEAMSEPETQSFLEVGVWSIDPSLLREELKDELKEKLIQGQWPSWFNVPEEVNFQAKRKLLTDEYDKFIDKRGASKKKSVALYYKAMVNEYTPDGRIFVEEETLHFYSDYPHRQTLPIWYQLYKEFPQSAESLEARWRIAVHLAGQGDFTRATDHCEVAIAMGKGHLKNLQEKQTTESSFLTAFTSPSQTAMTVHKLNELNIKIQKFTVLIGVGNRTESKESEERLARFVLLNPHSLEYSEQLDALLDETEKNDPLRDNILLARILPQGDSQLKAKELKELSEKFANTDGGVEALYELAMLNIRFQKVPETGEEEKKRYLTEARDILKGFIEMYPESILAIQAKTMLERLPAGE